MFRPLKVLATEGTLHHARFPAPVSGGVQLICDTLNVASAAVGKMLSCSDSHKDNTMAVWTGSSLTYSMFGTNQYGEAFGTLMILTSLGGGGARYFADGHDNAGTVGAPRYSCINVESAELIYPMLYIYRKRAIDSGGPGKFRGGVSAESLIVPYGVEALPVSVTTSGCDQSNSVGIDGGYPGGGASSLVKYGTDIWDLLKHGDFPTCWDDIQGEAHVLLPKQSFVLRGSDIYNGVPHGGGGFGDPLDRDPELVRRDVVNGYVSLGSARERYGVALDPQTLDLMAYATHEQRSAQRTDRLSTADSPGLLKGRPAEQNGVVRRLGENLQIQGEAIQCVRCSAIICQKGENPKSFCAVRRVPLKNANPWTALRWKGESEHFDLVEYICPACGGLLYVDERLKAETSHWHDYHLE